MVVDNTNEKMPRLDVSADVAFSRAAAAHSRADAAAAAAQQAVLKAQIHTAAAAEDYARAASLQTRVVELGQHADRELRRAELLESQAAAAEAGVRWSPQSYGDGGSGGGVGSGGGGGGGTGAAGTTFKNAVCLGLSDSDDGDGAGGGSGGGGGGAYDADDDGVGVGGGASDADADDDDGGVHDDACAGGNIEDERTEEDFLRSIHRPSGAPATPLTDSSSRSRSACWSTGSTRTRALPHEGQLTVVAPSCPPDTIRGRLSAHLQDHPGPERRVYAEPRRLHWSTRSSTCWSTGSTRTRALPHEGQHDGSSSGRRRSGGGGGGGGSAAASLAQDAEEWSTADDSDAMAAETAEGAAGTAFDCEALFARPRLRNSSRRSFDPTSGAQPQGVAGMASHPRFKKSPEVRAAEQRRQMAAGGGGGGLMHYAPQQQPGGASADLPLRNAEVTLTRRAPLGRPPTQQPSFSVEVAAAHARRAAVGAGSMAVVLDEGAGAADQLMYVFVDPTAYLQGEEGHESVFMLGMREAFEVEAADRALGKPPPPIVPYEPSNGLSAASFSFVGGWAASLPKALLPPGAAKALRAMPLFNLLLVRSMRDNLVPGSLSQTRSSKVRTMGTVLAILVTQAVVAGELANSDVASLKLRSMVKVARHVCCTTAAERYVRSIFNHFYGANGAPSGNSKSNGSAEDYLRMARLVTSCLDAGLADALDVADTGHLTSYAPPLGGASAAEEVYNRSAKRCKHHVDQAKGGRARRQAVVDLSSGVLRGVGWHWSTHDAFERFFELLNVTFRAALAASSGATSSSAAAASPCATAAAAAAAFVAEFPGMQKYFRRSDEILRATREVRQIALPPAVLHQGNSRPNTMVHANVGGVSVSLGAEGNETDVVTWNARANAHKLKCKKAGSVNHPCGQHVGDALELERTDLTTGGCREDAPLFTGSHSLDAARRRISEEEINVNLSCVLSSFLGVTEPGGAGLNAQRLRSELTVVQNVTAMVGGQWGLDGGKHPAFGLQNEAEAVQAIMLAMDSGPAQTEVYCPVALEGPLTWGGGVYRGDRRPMAR